MDEVDNGAHDPVRTVVVGSTSSDEVPRPAEAKRLHANRLMLTIRISKCQLWFPFVEAAG